jgi:prepilin-type N-terminal cleavage/methylation domain-containing protein
VIRRRLAAAQPDAGFTLIEMVMAMVIMTIITGPITAMTIIGYNTWTSSTTSLYVSHDRQLLETYFGRDATSATSATVGTAGSCVPAGVTVSSWVADLKWKGSRQIDGTWTNSYESAYATTIVGTKPVLQRWLCTSTTVNGTTTTAPAVVLTVAHSLSTTVAPPVTATCWIGTTSATAGTCPSVTASTPVSMAITVTDAANVSYTISTEQRAVGG